MGIPVINGRDVIHGSKTIFPIPLAQAASWDYDLIKDSARIMSEEASYDGVHWTFAPMLDICTDPRWGRIIESPGEDPYLGRMFARASIEGIQGKDMKKPNSLADISLSQEQIECARFAKEKGKNVIAVVFAGRPLAITALMHYCDAVLWAWHGGTECGTAAAEILFGDFNPCGKLPVTIPRATGQIPIFYNQNRNECDLNGYYENKMNYRDCVSTPLFEFGYGLSYSDFSYGEFKTQLGEHGIEVTMRIKNVGGYDGSDVVQCYVSDVVASASRPIKELKAYKKLFLKKGEERSITLSISFKELEFYNIQGERVFENGEFEIQVGKSCKNILFSERITVNKN